MADDGWHQRTLDAVKAVIRAALGTETIDQADAATLLGSLADELQLDARTQFAIGQELTARAFDAAMRSRQVESAGTIGEIESSIANAETLSPKADRPAHIPIDRQNDRPGSDVQRHYVRRVRELVPGVEEREGLLGGYVSLADLCQRRSEQTGEWAVYNPAALGMGHTVDGSCLYELVRKGRVRLESIQGHGFDKADSLRIRVFNPGSRVLVRIERGTVFERRIADDIQNLSVRDEVVVWLNPGTHELTAFGLCMDQNASPPGGQPMLLTPWVLRRRVDSQEDLWEFTDRPEREEDEQSVGDVALYEFALFGETRTAESQKDAFTSVFTALSERYPAFLDSIVALYEDEKSEVVPIVARRRSDLPDWARGSSVRLGVGYWLHTAMGGKVKLQKLREACEVAGVEFGDPEGLRIEF